MPIVISDNDKLHPDIISQNLKIKISEGKSQEYLETDNSFVFIEGFIYDLEQQSHLSIREIEKICYDVLDSHSPLEDRYTGQFTVIFLHKENILIFSDFIGVNNLMYALTEQEIIITNSEESLLALSKKLDKTGLLQTLIGPLNIPLHSRSHFNCIYSLLPGEYLHFRTDNCSIAWRGLDSIQSNNTKIDKRIQKQVIDKLTNNSSIFAKKYKNITLPISGGVDSRITLSSFTPYLSSCNINTLSYGESSYIDNRIAAKLSKHLDLTHRSVSFRKKLFPTLEEVESTIKNGGNFMINSWFSVISSLENNDYIKENHVILLGDVLDMLRAKNIKSIRSRKNRIGIVIKSLIGMTPKLTQLNETSFLDSQMRTLEERLESLLKEDPLLLRKLEINKYIFLKQTKEDLKKFIFFVKSKTYPKSQENLEESFFIFTWGGKTMAKQVNVFKGFTPAYILMANRHLVKYLLNLHPFNRFEDALTHRLLTTEGFNSLSEYETSQIPFVSYKSNIYFKYLVWLLRSSIDQLIIKLRLVGLSRKDRLVKHIEWSDYYREPTNTHLLLAALKDSKIKEAPVNIFTKRKKGGSWPLSEVDITPFLHISYLINKEYKS